MPNKISPELAARRIAAAAVLADYRAALASAPLTRPPGREWMLRLASVLEDLLDALGDTAEVGEDQADEDDFEPYCHACGASIGIFTAHGDDWRHFRGDGTADSPVELYDTGHAPVVAWRMAGVR